MANARSSLPFATSTPPSLSAIPTYMDPVSNEIQLRGRIKDVGSAVAVYQTLFQADLLSSRERARNQQMIDGAPPFSVGGDRAKSLAGRSNVNWGLSTQSQKNAEMPYSGILEAIDEFCSLPTEHGTETERLDWEPIMAEEFTTMLREWDEFYFLWQYNARLFVSEGLSFAFFEDDRDWRWLIYGQQHFKYTRRIRASVNSFDIVACKVDMLPHLLWEHVQNKKIAEEEGWSPEDVKDAIKTACQHGVPSLDQEEWEKVWKDNDFNTAMTSVTVETVHTWARNTDGTICHQISRYDGGGGFLYESKRKFKNFQECIVAFPYGIGSNGDFQSIRGHAQETFASSSAYNRLLCKMLDGAIMAATPHLKLTSEDAANQVPITPLGPYMQVDNGYDFVGLEMANASTALLPALNILQGIFNNRSGPYNSGAFNPSSDKTERTAYEKEMQFEKEGQISTGGMDLFFAAWKRLLKQVVKRAIRKDLKSSDPGGQEAWQFRNRCLKRGVPLEAIYRIDVDRLEVNAGIGRGSAVARKINLDRLSGELYWRLDPEGQRIVDRMMAAEYGGLRLAKKLVPRIPGMRPPIDVQIANLENNQLVQGMEVPVEPNQNQSAHIETHLTLLGSLYSALSNMQLPMEQAIPKMFPVWQHTNEHMQMLDPNNPNLKGWKQTLEVMGEDIINGQKHLDALAAKQQKAQGQGQGQPQSGEPGDAAMPSSVYREAVKAQTMLGFLQQKNAMALQQMADKHQLSQALMDAKAAHEMQLNQVTNRAA